MNHPLALLLNAETAEAWPEAFAALIEAWQPDLKLWFVGSEADQLYKHWQSLQPESQAQIALTWEGALADSSPADLLIFTAPVWLPFDFFRKISSKIEAFPSLATLTPFANAGGLNSLPIIGQNASLPSGWTPGDFQKLLSQESPQSFPELPMSAGPVIYLRRTAWQNLGGFNAEYRALTTQLLDYSLRVLGHGLMNHLDDTLFVTQLNATSREFWSSLPPIDQARIEARYPWVRNVFDQTREELEASFVDGFQRHFRPLFIGLDGRRLSGQGPITGTQRYVVQLLRNLLEQRPQDHFELLVFAEHAPALAAQWADWPRPPHLILVEELHQLAPLHWDVFHRTYQVDPQELDKVRPYARRLVVSYLDLIAYKNPAYAPNFTHFSHFRTQSSTQVATVDGVLAISEYGRQDILKHFSIPPERVVVSYLGADLEQFTPISENFRWQKFSTQYSLKEKYLLCIGTDFAHKNLVGTLHFYRHLLEKFAIPADLVLAGPHAHGGTLPEVQRFLKESPLLQQRVHLLGPVPDEDLPELYRRAGALLYLSHAEGFGLPPLEAMATGCPVVASALTSLPEVLGQAAFCAHPGDWEALAAEVLRLLQNKPYRQDRQKYGFERASAFQWANTAKVTWDFYEQLLCWPRRSPRVPQPPAPFPSPLPLAPAGLMRRTWRHWQEKGTRQTLRKAASRLL